MSDLDLLSLIYGFSRKFFSILTKYYFPSALGKGSDLEKAVTTLVLVYNNAADAEGKLVRSEAKKLLQTQFTHFIQVREL